jgi:hypothetical protein
MRGRLAYGIQLLYLVHVQSAIATAIPIPAHSYCFVVVLVNTAATACIGEDPVSCSESNRTEDLL